LYEAAAGKGSSSIGMLKLDKKDIYLVIVAFRDDNSWQQVDKMNNLIVLDKEHLQGLYSPSLSTWSQFVTVICKGIPAEESLQRDNEETEVQVFFLVL